MARSDVISGLDIGTTKTAAVIASIGRGESLMGAGPTSWEGELARLLVECVPNLQSVQITNTGSEATFNAFRLARAATGRDGVVIMQGGYNGWHNDVAFNLADPLARSPMPAG